MATDDVSDVELQQLLQKLECGEDEQQQALARLAKISNWNRDHVTALRLGGHVARLAHHLEVATPLNTLQDTLVVLLKAAEQDIACKGAILKEGAVRRLCKLLDRASRQNREIVLLSVRLLHQCINSGDIERAPAVEELFRLGAASKAVRFLEDDDVELALATGGLFWEVTDIASCRERCRDLGIVPTVLQLLAANPDVPSYMGFINNLSRSEALHLTLQEYGVIDVLEKVLHDTTVEVVRTQALITVAHVYAGQEGHSRSEKLLSAYDASCSVMSMMDACLHGDSMFGGAWWALEEVVQAVQSLSQKEQQATRLWKGGCVELLIEVLTKRAHDSDAVLQACRAISNLASLPSLKGKMQQKKELVAAAQTHEESQDLRVQDAAKATLLQLGALKDKGVLAADSALSGDSRDYSQTYDVFLSHKRTDSKDFARALYNLLVVRSFKTFLDYEYREELSDLGQIVANSTNLVFILTDNIFDSPWCIRELEAAVTAGVNIILLVKEGSRWKNEEGQRVCEFPGANILGKLPEQLQSVFTRKALYHSDEYYQTFVEMLVKKIIRAPEVTHPSSFQPPVAATTAAAAWMQQPTVAGPFMQGQPMPPLAFVDRQGFFTPAMPAAFVPSASVGGGETSVVSLQQQAELAAWRREMLAAMGELRRDYTAELSQVRLDLSQQLQQLRREMMGAVSELGSRMMESVRVAVEAAAAHGGGGQQSGAENAATRRHSEVVLEQLNRLREQVQLLSAAAAVAPTAGLGLGGLIERPLGRQRNYGGFNVHGSGFMAVTRHSSGSSTVSAVQGGANNGGVMTRAGLPDIHGKGL